MNQRPVSRQRPLTLPLAALFLALSPALRAQTAAPVIPDTGSILQQIQPTRPTVAPSNGTGLRIEQGPATPVPAGVAFEVKSVQIVGNTVFDTPTLHALVADAEGSKLTLAQLLEVAARITDYYRSGGYPLARAVIRAQVIRNGAVSVDVLEARYGKIEIDNRSAVNDALLQATLASLQGGQLVSQAALDHALLLLSDVPGIRPEATLKPGETVGSSDLHIEAAPGEALAGSVVADNFGSRYTGRARIGANVDLINPLHHGDVLSASVLDSGSGLAYGRLAYESLLDGAGTRLGGSYSLLRYKLDGSLEPLAVHGTAGVTSLWARRQLLRSNDANVYAQLRLDRMQLRDHIDSASIRTDRNLDVIGINVSGDARDDWLHSYGALNSWTLGWTGGRLNFRDAAAQAADASTGATQGGFSSWHASLSRLQNVSAEDGLYFAVSGQWASANLDSSQKMSAGGQSSVRAYDAGVLSGDAGVQATAELHHEFGSDLGRCQLIAFVDAAALRINASPWTTGPNHANLSGVGVGFNWAAPSQWQVRTSLAIALGAAPALLEGAGSTRAWLEVRKSY